MKIFITIFRKTLTESSFDTFVEVLTGLKDLANLELEFGEYKNFLN